MPMQRDVLLAVVLDAHGLKGEVKVKTFTAAPEKLGAYGPLHALDGRLFTVTALRASREGEAVAGFAEIKDRTAAEALKGTELFVEGIGDEPGSHVQIVDPPAKGQAIDDGHRKIRQHTQGQCERKDEAQRKSYCTERSHRNPEECCCGGRRSDPTQSILYARPVARRVGRCPNRL